MLIPATNPASESDLLACVRSWLDLLGSNQLEAACEELDEPNSYGIVWTPEKILRTIDEAFGPDSRFRVEHPEGPIMTTTAGAAGTAEAEVWELADGSGYRVDHDVPLNGAYSELTAQFEFLWRGGQLAMILHDIHVL